MRFDRDEYIALMLFGDARPMLVELFGLLKGLDEEWRAQGATEDEISLKAFDLDYVEIARCGGNCDIMSNITPHVLDETAEYVISRDEYGRTTKLIKSAATIPLPLDYPVKTMDDWLRMKHMFQYNDQRIDWDAVRAAKAAREKGALVTAHIPGGFDLPRQLMGEEGACVCYYDDPELMADVISTITDTAVRVLSRISDELVIDHLMVHEDMAGKSGPLAGPKQVREVIAPYYRAVWDMLRSGGATLFSQDSDGNMAAVIPAFLDAGVNIMYPAEPAAGMDIVKLREQYGTRLAFWGGIDKHVLRRGKADIQKELEYKLQPRMRKGMSFGLDHRITNGTPIENYRYYIKKAREMLGI